jgi:hypothetical protein
VIDLADPNAAIKRIQQQISSTTVKRRASKILPIIQVFLVDSFFFSHYSCRIFSALNSTVKPAILMVYDCLFIHRGQGTSPAPYISFTSFSDHFSEIRNYLFSTMKSRAIALQAHEKTRRDATTPRV